MFDFSAVLETTSSEHPSDERLADLREQWLRYRAAVERIALEIEAINCRLVATLTKCDDGVNRE